MDGTEPVGVQGPTTSRSYFTQKQRYQKFYDAKWYDTKLQENDPIGWSAAKYKDWEEMHKESIMWFDTAGCFDPNAFASTQFLKGDINRQSFGPVQNGGAWYRGVETLDTPDGAPVGAPDQTVTDVKNTYPVDSDGNVNWSMSIQRNVAVPLMNDATSRSYRSMLDNYIKLVEDCDMDCQKLGSGFSAVAAINQISMGFILLNFLCMFIGAWRWRARVFSTYCTYVSCLVQFIIMILSSTMLFTNYAFMCARSTTPTAGDMEWRMADDYGVLLYLWGTQWVWMFVFVCAGMCQQYKAPK